MELLLTIILLFGITISITHIIGLILLAKSHDKNINGTQKYLILWLSLTEVGLSVVSIVRQSVLSTRGSRKDPVFLCIHIYFLITIENMYNLIMFLITLDRFLEIRLNIKYGLCWKKSKAKYILLSAFVTLNAAYAAFLYIFLAYRQSTLPLTIVKCFSKYYIPVIDFIFVVFTTTAYSYIFSKLYKNRRKDDAIRGQLQLDEPVNTYKVNKYRIPFWIIATFFIFKIIPDIVFINVSFDKYHRQYLFVVSVVLYRLGYIADAFIYIYSLDVVKKKLHKFKKRWITIPNQDFNIDG